MPNPSDLLARAISLSGSPQITGRLTRYRTFDTFYDKEVIVTTMKQLLLGFTIGIVTGAMALKKMEKSDVPEKALKAAQKKLKD